MLCEEESIRILTMPKQSLTMDGLFFNEDTAIEAKYSTASINVTYMH
jgi:HKD family nuclease